MLRFAAGAFAALALIAPVRAQSPSPSPEPSGAASPAASPTPYAGQPPTAVVVRIEGGYHPANRWLWYDRDGTARFEGILDRTPGRFRARVDYRRVAQILTDNEMCLRHATVVRPATVAMDAFFYRVSVRCGNAWRTFTSGDVFETKGHALSRTVVRELEQLAAGLAWERTDENVGPPDGGNVVLTRPESARAPE